MFSALGAHCNPTRGRTVADAGHAVLAHAKAKVAAGVVVLLEVAAVIEVRLVRRCKVRAAAKEGRYCLGNRVHHLRDVLDRLDCSDVRSKAHAAAVTTLQAPARAGTP